MNTMRKIILIVIGLTILGSGCLSEEINASKQTGTICIRYAPHNDEDMDDFIFKSWVGARSVDYLPGGIWIDKNTNRQIGFALAEDGAIWNTMNCAMTERAKYGIR